MADQLRFGVVGVNGRGGGLAREIAASTDAVVVGVADLNRDVAEQVAGETDARVWTDYETMLTEADLDAVVIGTPHHLHAPMGMSALDAGLHTFIEKPISNTVSEADRLVARAAEQGLTLGIGHNYRTFPGNIEMKKQVERLGDIHRAFWQWTDTRAEAYYGRDPWRSSWSHAGGGVLMNQTSHDIDLMCWMLGEPEVVCGVVGNWAHGFELEDTAAATIRFRSGAVACVQFSICDRPLNYRQVSGDNGTLEFRDAARPNSVIPETLRVGTYAHPMRAYISGQAGISSSPDIVWDELKIEGERKFPPMMPDFIDAILTGREPVTSGRSARTAIELINGILMSSFTGQAVRFPLDRDAYDSLFDDLVSGKRKVERWGTAR